MPEPRATAPDRPTRGEALRLLSVRPLTCTELRKRLSSRGHPEDEIDEALERLRVEGYLDDAGLARHYIAVRAERRGHGRNRLVRELRGRGVSEGVAVTAWEQVVADGEIDPAALLSREVERRVGREGGRLEQAAYRRVYNTLLRAGFEASEIVSELRGHRVFEGSGRQAGSNGYDEDELD